MENPIPPLGYRCRYPARESHMHKRSQWSIGRMLLWFFVAALVASHFASFYQRQIVGFTDFTLDRSDVEQWMSELDPSVRCHGGGGGSSQSGDSVDSEFDYLYSSKNTTSEQLLAHLKLEIREQLGDENWSIHGTGGGDDSFSYHARSGRTHFRIYGWLVPNAKNSYASHLMERGENLTRVKILRVGYLKQ